MTTRSLGARFSRAYHGFDKVVLTVLVVLGALAASVPDQAVASAKFVLGSFVSILPYMLLAVVLAGWARASGADEQVARAFGANEALAIPLAALIGTVAPFCGVGVVPLVAAALIAGVPLSAVMAFWISSPLMNPAIYLLSVSELGQPFALARVVSAFGLGLAAGYCTSWLVRRGALADALKPHLESRTNRCGIRAANVAAPIVWPFWKESTRRAAFAREVRKTGPVLAKWMLLAFLLESLLVAYVPSNLLVSLVGRESAAAVPLAVAVGIPAYLNGYAAIPLVAGLIRMGMSEAAALAFMTAGAVTSIPAMVGVLALVRPALFAWYLAVGILGSLATGYAYQWVLG